MKIKLFSIFNFRNSTLTLLSTFYILLLTTYTSAQTEIRPTTWAHKLKISPFYNLYKVDDFVYRSEQPTKEGMNALDSMGIKSILNLRNILSDKNEAQGTKLTLCQFRINTWTITYEEVVASLRILINVDKPVLVHCKHGSDRTGCIIAAYRMAAQGWTKAEAIKEFREGGYGFHEELFENILELHEKIDIEQLRAELDIY